MEKYPKISTLVKIPASIKKFTDRDVKQSISNLSRYFQGGRELGRFHLTLLSGRKNDSICFELSGGQCRVSNDTSSTPNFEIKTSKDTWMEIAKGKLSPADAFLEGKMEVHGNLGFGKRLYAKAMPKRSKEESILEF